MSSFSFLPPFLLRRNEPTAFRVCARCSSRKQRVDDGDDSRRERHGDGKRKERRRRTTKTTTMRFNLCVCVCVFALFLRKSNTRFCGVRIFGNERYLPSSKTQKHNYLYFISHPTQEQQQRRRRDDFIYYHIAIENIHALRVHLFLVSRCSSHCFCHHHHHHQQQQQQHIRVSSPTHDFCLTPPSQ